MTEPLHFYVDPAWRKKDDLHTPLLYPFWGNALSAERTPFQHAMFEQHSYDTSRYAITDDIEAADAILMPYSYNIALARMPGIIEAVSMASHTSGLTVLVDGLGDVEHPISIRDHLVLRYGGYRFSRNGREIFIPPYAEDLLERYYDGTLQPREKREGTPSVAFTGWTALTPYQEIRAVLKELPDRLRGIADSRYRAKRKGVFFRRDAVRVLSSSSEVDAQVRARPSYSGHVHSASGNMEILRKDFIDNIMNADYALDVRGDANASTRLYEILSLGRIPVIVDTERNFPLESDVDYRSFALIVDFKDMQSLPERIRSFHAALSPDAYLCMQACAREAFVKHFRIDAVTAHVMNEVASRMTRKP